MAKKASNEKMEKGNGFVGSVFDFAGVADSEIGKKISAKIMIGNVKSAPEGPLFGVVGIARDTKCGTTDFGEWTALVGDFVAVNAEGKKLRATKLFLPDVALDLVLNALQSSDSVEFGFDIFKQNDESVAVGYVYTCKPLVRPTQNDPLADLTKKVPMLPM